MAAGDLSLTAGASRSTGIATATVNNGAGVLSSEIDNSTIKALYASLELLFTLASASENGPWYVWVTYAQDGTHYENQAAVLKRPPDAIFMAAAGTSADKQSAIGLRLAPFKFKLWLWNATGQNSADSSVTLLCYTYGENVAQS